MSFIQFNTTALRVKLEQTSFPHSACVLLEKERLRTVYRWGGGGRWDESESDDVMRNTQLTTNLRAAWCNCYVDDNMAQAMLTITKTRRTIFIGYRIYHSGIKSLRHRLIFKYVQCSQMLYSTFCVFYLRALLRETCLNLKLPKYSFSRWPSEITPIWSYKWTK